MLPNVIRSNAGEVLLGCAPEVWPPPSSYCIRPEVRVRSFRSERTAGVFLEQQGERPAVESDPLEEGSLPG